MRLIALAGKSKSGKDTVGEMLVKADPRGATIAFADKLKEVCMDLFGFTHEDCYTDAGKDRKTDFPVFKCPACQSIDCTLEAPSQVVCHKCTAVGEPKAFESNWTVRMALQYLGTEGVRRIDKNTWVRHALRRASSYLEGNYVGATSDTQPKLFVAITDCRFKSECDAIWKAGGEVWRIRRPETDRKAQGLVGHQSEVEIDTIPDSMFQHVISNDATLDVLRAKALEGLGSFLQRHA